MTFMQRISALVAVAALAGCVQTASDGGSIAREFSPALRDIAAKRVQFVAEAVCLNNKTRAAQERAIRRLAFPDRRSNGALTTYINPGTQTYVLIGPAPDQSFNDPQGGRTYGGHGCSVGSPAVDLRTVNGIIGEILQPRLLDGTNTLSRPVGQGTGTNERGGVGFFFEDLAITTPSVTTSQTNSETGETRSFSYPVILFFHN